MVRIKNAEVYIEDDGSLLVLVGTFNTRVAMTSDGMCLLRNNMLDRKYSPYELHQMDDAWEQLDQK